MKKLINFIAIAFVAVAFSACGDKPTPVDPVDPGTLTMYKSWQLTSWGGEAFPMDVYINFDEQSKTFTLYQNVVTVGYVKFTGTFTFDEGTKKLTGEYSDGKPWNETYTRTDMTVDRMDLLGSSGFASVYTNKTIPDEIINQAAPASISISSDVEVVRFL